MYKTVKVVITIGEKKYYPARTPDGFWMLVDIKDINDVPSVKAENLNKIVEMLISFEYTMEIRPA